MAAATALFMALKPGDHVVAPSVMYWSLRNWLIDFARPWGLDVEFVPSADMEALRRAVRPGKTALVWIRSPSNPMWDVTDIRPPRTSPMPPGRGSPWTAPRPAR